MDPNEKDRIDKRQAAILLGLPVEELRWHSRASRLSRREKSDRGEEVFFTYEQLRRISLLSASSDD